MTLICPACDCIAPPAATSGPLAVCAGCGACLYVEQSGTVRRATGDDVYSLPNAEITTLRKAHGRVTRGARP